MNELSERLGRKQYLVDRSLQLRFSAWLAAFGAFFSALLAGLVYAAHVESMRALVNALTRSGDRLSPELTQSMAAADATLWGLMAGVAFLMAAILALFGVLVTHRVAGPVHLLSHYLGVLASGRYPTMRPLRKNDELKAFFDSFRKAVEGMRQRESEEAQVLQRAVDALGPLAQEPATRELVAQLQAMSERKSDATEQIPVGRE